MTVRHVINYHYSGFLLITIENVYRARHAREAPEIVAIFKTTYCLSYFQRWF